MQPTLPPQPQGENMRQAPPFKGIRLYHDRAVPEFRVDGPRRVEIMPDGSICTWQCIDYPSEVGEPAFCVPVLKLIIPPGNLAWSAYAVAQWTFDRGICRLPPVGPVELAPPMGLRH